MKVYITETGTNISIAINSKKYSFTKGYFNVKSNNDNIYVQDSTNNIIISYKDIVTYKSRDQVIEDLKRLSTNIVEGSNSSTTINNNNIMYEDWRLHRIAFDCDYVTFDSDKFTFDET